MRATMSKEKESAIELGQRLAALWDARYQTEQDLLDQTRELIRQGADLRQGDARRETALHKCAKRGLVKAAQELIEAGADVNQKDLRGSSALIKAAQSASEEMVRAMLDAGARVGDVDTDGYDALMWAAAQGPNAIGMIRALLGAGADPGAVAPRGTTALHIACGKGSAEAIRALWAKSDGARLDGEGASPMSRAIGAGSIEAIQALHELGASWVEPREGGAHDAMWTAMTASNWSLEDLGRMRAMRGDLAWRRGLLMELAEGFASLIGWGGEERLNFARDWVEKSLGESISWSAVEIGWALAKKSKEESEQALDGWAIRLGERIEARHERMALDQAAKPPQGKASRRRV